jgi:hypothetical protein
LDSEGEHPQRQIAEQFVEHLAQGELQHALEKLRELESLEHGEIVVLADLLSENAPLQIFPWHLAIGRRRSGNPGLDEPSAEQHDDFQQFLNAIDSRDSKKAAEILRTIEKLKPHQVETLADLMAGKPTCSSCMKSKLKLARRGGGRPRRLELRARDFVVNLALRSAATGQMKDAIYITHKRTALSRATIYRARPRRKAKSGT